jgi:hypothetical protein
MRYLTLLSLNAFDGIATTSGILAGHLSEANPLLAGFSAWTILAIKLVPISYMVLVLYNTRTHRLSHNGALVLIAVYCHIFFLHVQWIGAVL